MFLENKLLNQIMIIMCSGIWKIKIIYLNEKHMQSKSVLQKRHSMSSKSSASTFERRSAHSEAGH